MSLDLPIRRRPEYAASRLPRIAPVPLTKNAGQTKRLVSAPAVSLGRDGIVACRDVSLKEAWSRCAVKKNGTRVIAKLSNNTTTIASGTGQASSLIISDAEATSSSSSSATDSHLCELESHDARCIRQRSASEKHFVSVADRTSPFARQTTPSISLQRNDSCDSRSSYASDSSWLSSANTSCSQPSRCSDPSTYRFCESQHGIVKDDVATLPHLRNKSTEVIMPISDLTVTKTEQAGVPFDKEHLQNQLGRPTDSDDSPYAICSQYRLRPRFQFDNHEETKDKAPKKSRLINLRQSIMLLIGKKTGQTMTAHPKVEVMEAKGDINSSPRFSRVPSIYYSDDEAGRLWKSLEMTLGINLDCKGDERKTRQSPEPCTSTTAKPTIEATSRLPRLRPGHLATSRGVERSYEALGKRASRLPIPISSFRKQCWEPKEKRDSGIAFPIKGQPCARGPNSIVPGERSHPTLVTPRTVSLPVTQHLQLDDAIRRQLSKGAMLRIAS